MITLDQNYRSTETILNAANCVIRNNGARREKRLWSALGEGRALDWHITADEEDEARHVVDWLKHVRHRAKAEWTDFAVLYRANNQSRPIEMSLRQAGIPYIVVGGQDFFERAEVKDIIAYLKVIANPRDETAFLRVINMPRRGIGDTTLHKVHEICVHERVSLTRALSELLKRDLLPREQQLDLEGGPAAANGAAKGIREFLALLAHFRRRFQDCQGTLHEIATDLVETIGYRQELERACKKPEHALNRWGNIEIVLEAVREYEAEEKEKGMYSPTLTGFLDASHLSGDAQQSREERRQTGVTLMTIHAAKGLEFPFVFLVGIEEGLLPHERAIRENTLEEERRLFYVALTRGKRHVTLFEALSRNKHGRERMTATSRFMKEIPDNLLRQHIHAARDMVQSRVAPDAVQPKAKGKKQRARKPGAV